MSIQNQAKNNAPIHTIRCGATCLKIWENISAEGRLFYNVTLGRTYTDKTGQVRETSTLRSGDLDKLFYLTTEAKRMIHMVSERNKDVERSGVQKSPAQIPASIHTQANPQLPMQNKAQSQSAAQGQSTVMEQGIGLTAQRDAAMKNRAVPEKSNNVAIPAQQHSPEQ